MDMNDSLNLQDDKMRLLQTPSAGMLKVPCGFISTLCVICFNKKDRFEIFDLEWR